MKNPVVRAKKLENGKHFNKNESNRRTIGLFSFFVQDLPLSNVSHMPILQRNDRQEFILCFWSNINFD